MEICSNCFKKSSQASPFCSYCGYPNIDIGLKLCAKGHIIYETYKNCPFCHHLESLGKSLVNQPAGENTEGIFNKNIITMQHVTGNVILS